MQDLDFGDDCLRDEMIVGVLFNCVAAIVPCLHCGEVHLDSAKMFQMTFPIVDMHKCCELDLHYRLIDVQRTTIVRLLPICNALVKQRTI